MTRLLIVYDTESGTHGDLARRCGERAAARGAEVRVRRVRREADGAPGEGARAGEAVPVAVPDVRWCDALVLGSPTHFGGPTPGMAAFLDSLRPLWAGDELRGLVVGAMSSSHSPRGGRESTILDLQRAALHLGAVVVPGHRWPRVAGQGPYGVSLSGTDPPSDADTTAAVDALTASVLDVASRSGGRPSSGVPRVAVVAERADGDLDALAAGMAEGARASGADVVRLEPAAVLDPGALEGADAVAIGSRVRASQPGPSVVNLLREWGSPGPAPDLAGMPVSAFVTTDDADDGAEAGLQGIYAGLQHAGAVVVPAGPPVVRPPDGAANPYGTSAESPAPGPGTLVEAHEQMRGLVDVAGRLAHATRRTHAPPE